MINAHCPVVKNCVGRFYLSLCPYLWMTRIRPAIHYFLGFLLPSWQPDISAKTQLREYNALWNWHHSMPSSLAKLYILIKWKKAWNATISLSPSPTTTYCTLWLDGGLKRHHCLQSSLACTFFPGRKCETPPFPCHLPLASTHEEVLIGVLDNRIPSPPPSLASVQKRHRGERSVNAHWEVLITPPPQNRKCIVIVQLYIVHILYACTV